MALPSREELQAARRGVGKPSLIRQAVLVLCGAIFVTDLFEPKILALSALYAIPVMISVWLGRRGFTLLVSGVCVVLVVAAPLLALVTEAEPWTDTWLVVANRAVAIFTVGIVTSLGLMRQRVEGKLVAAREAAVSTLESIGDGVLAVDTLGRVRFMNPVAEALTGFASAEAVGHELSSVFRTSDHRPMRPPILDLPDGGGPVVSEGMLHRRDGRQVPIEEHRTPMRDENDVVEGHVIVFRDVTARLEREEAMRRLAYRDELTGLPNRTSLLDRISLELAHARRNQESLALLYLDLDGFKAVNDELGHHAGDAYLRAVATRLRAVLRAGDTVARLGGDEFTVILTGIAGAAEALAVAQKVLAALVEPLELEGRTVQPGASIGLALFPGDGDEPDLLLRRADKAMYRAKELGGRRVAAFAEPDATREREPEGPGSRS